MAGSNNLGYCTNKIITSSAGSENVVHCMNTFITSSLAFGCHVDCHRRIFVVGLLFLTISVYTAPRKYIYKDNNFREMIQSPSASPIHIEHPPSL